MEKVVIQTTIFFMLKTFDQGRVFKDGEFFFL